MNLLLLQLYVIPHPPDNPSGWAAKLYITPGKSILLTGLSLVGTCVLCLFIIGALHWRERRNDRMEKLQEANRFHFDAM
jgi:integrin alpha FG-GAP repeat containing protein 1